MPGFTTPWKIWIDTGGTFTDCIAISPEERYHRLKVLSSGLLRVPVARLSDDSLTVSLPVSVSRDFFRDFTAVVGRQRCKIVHFEPASGVMVLDRSLPPTNDAAIEITTDEEVPVFAARLLTETALSEDFPPIDMRLGSTRGTNALLERKGAKTALIITKGFKDLLVIGNQQRNRLFSLAVRPKDPLYSIVVEINERIASNGSVISPIDSGELAEIVQTLRRKQLSAVAVAFINSYKNPRHERIAGEFLRAAGFQFVSLSEQLSPQAKILTRAETTVANAYLEPIIHRYISRIQQGLKASSLRIMSSAGGLLPANDFKPKDSLLSGPAGGVMGALAKASLSGITNLLTFDMGGTSTDVSRCNGRPDYRFDCTVGDLKIFSPSLAIETIAAGGGSICSCDGFRLTVGPESASASPGPAAYGAGGPLTITDVNLLLGRLDSANFSIPIQGEMAQKALATVKRAAGDVSDEDLLMSFVTIANEKMAEAIRKISVQQGHDPGSYALFCFGGAGGQHACALASLLEITKVIIPYEAGLLSAFGIGNAAPECIRERQLLKPLSTLEHELTNLFDELAGEAVKELQRQGYPPDDVTVNNRLVFLRLQGQETSLEVNFSEGSSLASQFAKQYKNVYGHWLEGRTVEVESIRLIASLRLAPIKRQSSKAKKYRPQALRRKAIYCGGSWKQCPVFRWELLDAGASVVGPALVISDNSTVYVEPGWRFDLDEFENAILKKGRSGEQKKKHVAAAELELFTNRFSAIATEMGMLLQRTSFSVNIKERLDFSCALLDQSGNLVVNAPHIPVHLGSLGACVRAVMRHLPMQAGDVVITNHPAFGGSHLPDVTLIKAVFFDRKRIGFVASRAHHAEIGGTKPGSMPADAENLEQEGVVIPPTYLVRRGKSRWDEIEKLFTQSRYPTRSLGENLADINGALASVTLGAEATRQLCNTHGVGTIQHYMRELRSYTAHLVRKQIATMRSRYHALERLDDGSPLRVSLTRSKSYLQIDFTGSGPVHAGNLNATRAIVTSVVLYVLRLLVDREIPLNEGMLTPIKLIIPPGMLNPRFGKHYDRSPAVVGGNTEISQRLTDTLLKALGLAACSQGTMNNLLFGTEKFGYYETICGGVGAVIGTNGADAVHQHMTNTRITDPEIIELRYPVRLEVFAVRRGSGGTGKWRGGNGVVRQFCFLEPMELNLLSQHRIVAPYGLRGGKPGKTGKQHVRTSDGQTIRLKGTDSYSLQPGDRVVIYTPGGGGWGKK